MNTATGASSKTGGRGKNKEAVMSAPDEMTSISSALFYNRNIHNFYSYGVT